MPDFINVNGEAVSLAEALRWSIVEDTPSFVDATVSRVVIAQYARTQGLSATPKEIQRALDDIRYEYGIESARDTEQWMSNNNLTMEAVQGVCEMNVLQNAVLKSIPDDEIASYFDGHEADLTTVDLYGVRSKSLEASAEIATRIRDRRENFHLLAMAHSIDEESARQGGYLGRFQRDAIPEEIQVAVFSLDPGEVIGPLKTEGAYSILTITGLEQPTLDEVSDEIRQILFDALVDRLMRTAVVFHSVLSQTESD